MISPAQLRTIQKLGEQFMLDDVEIHHKSTQALDPSNPYGDDTVTYEQVTTVKGWLAIPNVGGAFGVLQAQPMAVGTFTLRVPVGTDIAPADDVYIKGERFLVVDTVVEATWQEWLRCALTRNTP
jgi:hypothetical protein